MNDAMSVALLFIVSLPTPRGSKRDRNLTGLLMTLLFTPLGGMSYIVVKFLLQYSKRTNRFRDERCRQDGVTLKCQALSSYYVLLSEKLEPCYTDLGLHQWRYEGFI